MEVHHISCGTLYVDSRKMFNNLPDDRIRKYYDLDNEGYLRISLNALLVAHKDRMILFDPGCADFLPARLAESYGFEWPESFEEVLAKVGVIPDQITDVIFTHLHFDHGSGAFIRIPGQIQPRFTNAKHHVLKSHFEYASVRKPGESHSFFTTFLKYVDRIHWLEEWNEEWLQFLKFNGHTKGMVVPKINAEGKSIYYLSDLIPMKLFMKPDVSSGYDLDCGLAIKEKNEFLNGISSSSELLLFHEPLKNSLFYP